MNAVLGLYFDPDNDPNTRAAMRQEFVVALASYPDWAVQRAFDAWVRTGSRRPTPGEIVILVGREMKPITDEIAKREREARERAEARPEISPEEMEQRRAFAKTVLRNNGFAKAMDRHKGPPREGVEPGEVEAMRAHLAAKGMA